MGPARSGLPPLLLLIRGRRIPVWAIELVKRRYKAQPKEHFSLDAFGAKMLRVLALRP